MSGMSIETAELSPTISCIRLHGEVDSSNLTHLKSAFDQIFSRKVYKVILNLGAIKYLSSSSIGVIIGGFTTAVKNGGQVVLATTPQSVVEVLRLIGLDSVLSFAKDEAEALKKLTGSGRKPR